MIYSSPSISLRNRLLTLLLFLLPLTAAGQSETGKAINEGTLRIQRTFRDETVEPAPSAAHMPVWSDGVVNCNNGNISVAVPLYTVHSGDATVPLSLVYSGNGFRERGADYTWGAGWSLSGGGCITRSIRGMPDCGGAQTTFEFRHNLQEGNSDDIKYLADLLHRRKDACYDRYNYRAGGYSGSFIIKDSRIHKLTCDDVRITFCGNYSEGTYDFLIITPDGTRYFFEEREHLEFHTNSLSVEIVSEQVPSDYTAVCGWQLSRIVSPSRTDTVRFSYQRIKEIRYDNERLDSYTYTFRSGMVKLGHSNGSETYTCPTRTYTDKCILSGIFSRTTHLRFRNASVSPPNSSTSVHQTGVTVAAASGNNVHEISLKYDGTQLIEVVATANGILKDRQRFSYYSSNEINSILTRNNPTDSIITVEPLLPGGDIGEYNGGKITSINTGNTLPSTGQSATDEISSVIDDMGHLRATRAMCIGDRPVLHLKSVTSALGTTATYTYEPSTCRTQYLGDSLVCTGLRVKEMTVCDTLTHRRRTVSYTYEGGRSTISFASITPSCFIMPAGSIMYPDFLGIPTYTSGATLTSSCRIPGMPMESAEIYYSRVTQDVTGTGIDAPLRTVCTYDLSDIEHPFIANGGKSCNGIENGFLGDNGRFFGSKIFNQSALRRETFLFAPHIISGHFQETCWEKAPLVNRIKYRHTSHGYKPVEEEFFWYSIDKKSPISTGIYADKVTRSAYSDVNGFTHDVTEHIYDFNYFETTLQSGRRFCDSTAVVHYYPDGHSRRITAVNRYNNRLKVPSVDPNTMPPLVELPDTIRPVYSGDGRESTIPLLKEVSISCMGQRLSRRWLYSSNSLNSFYRQLTDSGYTALPIQERVVTGGDTVTICSSYRIFTQGGLQRDSQHILFNGHETTRQDFFAYDRRGNLLSTAIGGGMPTAYRWNTESSTLAASLAGGRETASERADSVMTTFYTYEPLVGCTGITRPDGRHTGYDYQGGRLSEITNNRGEPTNSYDYSLYDGNGTNHIRQTTHLDLGQHALITDNYYDGFGAEVNNIQRHHSPSGKDIVTVIGYDAIGRKTEQWLPVPMAGCDGIVTNVGLHTASAQTYSDSHAVMRYQYEPQSGGELTTTIPAGESYYNHPATVQKLCSDPSKAELCCRRFILSGDYKVKAEKNYEAGELDVVLSTDADGRRQWTFTDWRGQKVLDRRDTGSGMADTYYIYDPVGNLRMVLPPAASAVLAAGNGTYDARTDLTLKRYAYVYRYDERLNCVEKRMPGCEPIRYAYDRTGTKVFSQDGNQRQRGVWSFALLDRFGREAVTGECQNPDSVALAKKWVHVDTPDFAARESTLGGSGYRSNVNLGNVRLLTANYYDDYTFISALCPDHNQPLPTTSGLRGLQTGSIKAVGNTMDYNTTLIGYDDEGRINFTQSAIAGRTMTEEKNYTLDGRVSQMRKETTEADGNSHTETYSYRYDAQARLLKVTHSLDGGAEMILSDNEYDELGRLLTDRREGSGLLTARYSYDIHSHIREMASPLFCQRLFYAEPSEGGIPLYGGAISGMDWQTIGDSVRSYRYQYDGLGRLTSADYLESGHSSDRYVTEYSYDLMGNILTLSRSGKVYDEIYGITDDLTYQYDGNRLIRVTNHAADTPAYKDAMYYADGADLDTERTYDANGNMTSNADSRISRISYDALNMPCRIDYIDGSRIDYTYAADGVKQRVDYYLNPYTSSLPDDDLGTACDSSLLVHTWREYAGNCVYVCDTLSMILIDGGYITFDYTTHQPIYHYYLKDYLGNNRITVSLADGRIEEVNHYYPFGGLMGDSRNATTQPYKYIGKELDRTHGLDWYDHGARHYDPVTGRWNVMDALAEKYYPWSPYVSCGNNSISTIDDNGMEWYRDIDNTIQYSPQVHSQKDLKKNQVYIGAYLTTGKGKSLVSYRRDGSILYANETKAYKRIWNQASVHYRRMGEKGGREVAAFILVDSRVLVLPDYKNTSMQSEIGDYGYLVGHGVIRKGKEKFNISAQIHTHQERMSDERASEADGLFSKKMGGLPVLVIGKDKVTRGFYYDFNDGKSFGFGDSLRFHELNKLSSWLNQHRRFFLQVK